MKITKEIVRDLFPLYAAGECSADTRSLVEEYLRQNPRDAEEWRRLMNSEVPGFASARGNLDEMGSLQRARKLVRRRSWVLGVAICCSFAPLSFLHTGDKTYWLFRESPAMALFYGLVGAAAWIGYGLMRARSKGL